MNSFEKVFLNWTSYIVKKIPFQSLSILNDEVILTVKPENLKFVLNFLRFHINSRFEILSCISGSDFPEKIERFEISYELLSLTYNSRLRIKTYINEKDFLESVCFLFNSANWWEREIFDLFGIFFLNHPDLRRLLTDYGFEGFPLRKNFPLSGFVEVRFDEKTKRIICEPLELTQNFRNFNYETSWLKIKT